VIALATALSFLGYVAAGMVALVFVVYCWAVFETRRFDRETDRVPDVHGDVPAVPQAALDDARDRAFHEPRPPFLLRCVHDGRGECATCYVARVKSERGEP
jgi:hypothetical protein